MAAISPRVMRKSTKLVMTEPAGNDEARKINLGNQVGVANQAVAGLAHGGGKKLPRQVRRHDEQGIRNGARRGQLGNLAEHDGEHNRREQRPDDGPRHADDGLLVADGDIAPREDDEQLAVAPEVAPVVFLRATGFKNQGHGSKQKADILKR